LVNGKPSDVKPDADGYLRLRRSWRAGDRLTLKASPSLRIEVAPGDANTIALLHGPLVLAADLGPAGEDHYDGMAPVLVSDDLDRAVIRPAGDDLVYHIGGAARPDPLVLRPFAGQHERRTAVYFQRFTEEGWTRAKARIEADDAARRALMARSSDQIALGEMQAERDHGLEAAISYPVVYRGRNGRDARSGGFFQFRLKVRPGSAILRATYWGEERNRAFRILIDGLAIAHITLDGAHGAVFFDEDYPIPDNATQGKSSILVRFEPDVDHTAGPVFGVLCLRDGAARAA